MRLIDADEFYEQIEEIRMEYLEDDTMSSDFAADVLDTVQNCYLKEAPTIDPESLRPNGKWGNPIKVDAENIGYKCSECGEFGVPCWHYCPNCGARMEG